ncbi:tetratricopeptide repeat protein [Tenacibaculum sp. S7007]|uniref:histidine kinase n=1 Tax=Tenacibaculum pelagium TaxID=2759527 RepID=A0A839AQ46_9FLAO|nr:tetratricopeptide repeat-containing sensor histidine kinase [Tenacibaculum pelagium]MBA6156339.1 tetratricopeptide repeat protein [Tenacibaculum pelagium]
MIFLKNIKKITFFVLLILISTKTHSNIKKPKDFFKKSFGYTLINKDSIYKKKFEKAYKKFKRKNYVEALKKSLEIYEYSKEGNENKLAHLSATLIADIYDKTHDYKKSLAYYKISLGYLKKSHPQNLDEIQKKSENYYGKIYLRIGGAYQKLYRNINISTDTLNHIQKLKDSAIYFYNKLENLNSINNDLKQYKAISYNNLSSIYQMDSLFTKAKIYAKKAINIHIETGDKINQARSQNNLGSVYLSLGDYNKAKTIYLNGIELIKNNNSQKAVKYKANLYYNLAWAMRNLKDYKAYDFQERYYEIEDNLRDNEVRGIIQEITAKHKENLEQQKIERVKEQRKLFEAQESKTNILFGALTLLILIVSGVVIYNYKLRQKNLQLKLSESNLLQQQSIEKLKSEAHTKILNAAIDGKESERKEIAEILHDNVSALLSSANMHLSATKKQLHNNTPSEIEKTQAIILEASQKVRDLSHNLVSSILLKFGLEYAIKDVAKKYSNSELKFDVSANNIHRYNQEFEIKIFNVIQELINNIIKHSKANNAEIIIKEEKSQLTILVKDDGVGFSTSSSSLNDGIGLNQIEARVKMMNGKLTINSEINNGASIFISVPIQQQKRASKLSSVS